MDIEFSHAIDSTLPADDLWSIVVASFEDSESSDLWPNELETLRCDRLEEGATVAATYHIGPVDAPQTYDIPEFDADARTFSYRTRPAHPLDGGGEVTVGERPAGSRLTWSGGYGIRPTPQSLGAAAFIKMWFERRFFDRIEANLRGIERNR